MKTHKKRMSENQISSDTPLRNLHGKKRLKYIWDYYKLPIALLGIFLYILVYNVYGHLTYKETLLYTALVNVNAGEALSTQLSDGFLAFQNADPSKTAFCLYSGLYLTDNENSSYYEYTYASRIKILGAIDGKQLDVVLMNQEAFDAFSQNGYLSNLDKLLFSEDNNLYNQLKHCLTKNIVILDDNSTDVLLNPSITYNAETDEFSMGIELSESELIRDSGLQGKLYLGIIENSPRKDTAISYIKYLFS